MTGQILSCQSVRQLVAPQSSGTGGMQCVSSACGFICYSTLIYVVVVLLLLASLVLPVCLWVKSSRLDPTRVASL